MSRSHIASTLNSQLNALRFQGILVFENYAQLTSMLERNLSPKHAAFFAEPIQEAGSGKIDWYSRAHEPAVPLSSLPEAKQLEARATVRRLASEINAYAEELKGEERGPKFLRGNILSLALHYPGEEYIFMAGEQPVLAGWGCGPALAGAEPEPLIRLAAAAPAAKEPDREAPGAQERKKGVFLPLLSSFLLGLLLLLGLYLLLTTLFAPHGCSFTERAPMPQERAANGTSDSDEGEKGPSPELLTALTAEKEKEESLRRRLEELRRLVLLRAEACVRTPPPEAEPAPEPEEEKPAEPAEPEAAPEEPPSLAELMPATPEPAPAPKPKPAPKAREEAKPEPKPAPEPKKPEPPKTKDLVIPKDAEKNNDLSFLEGCWTNATTLKDGRTGKPIRSTYCFDKNGRGVRTEQGIGHDLSCRSSASARFINGRLNISATEAACVSGGRSRGRYPKEAILCDRTVDGRANCYESQNDRWKARLQRVR